MHEIANTFYEVENAGGLTADKEEAGSELLEDDDLLALVDASQNDGDDAG